MVDPLKKNDNDELVEVVICTTESNDDWLKSARLIEKGDKKSMDEFERMDKEELELENG